MFAHFPLRIETEPALPSLRVRLDPAPGGLAWDVANEGGEPVAVRHVRAVVNLGRTRGPVRAFLHGWQSWSASRWATLGEDQDPATPEVSALLRQLHHADDAPVPAGELRSEWVVLLAREAMPYLALGFLDGRHHDGTFRLRRDNQGRLEVVVEAFLGGAVLAPGERRELSSVISGAGEDPWALLAGWAAVAGEATGARTSAPYQVGWCSWYHWFTSVTEDDVAATVALAGDWPFTVLQVDDGYQHDIGDWLASNDTFPSGVGGIADRIIGSGHVAGLWLAPFLAMGSSLTATEHPGWLARWGDGRPLVGNRNRQWGGDALALDLSRDDVVDHLERVARTLVEEHGFRYLKLDFLYAAHVGGVHADPSLTPAQRVSRGLEAIRRGAGDDVFLLGCGAPLLTSVGVVDGMRIGPDVAPVWEPSGHLPGLYRATEPATANALDATVSRAWMHRRLWLNDPDCVMLRSTHTGLTDDQRVRWARAVGASGGMALVSDDLSLLGRAEQDLLDEVVAAGQAADVAVAAGQRPDWPAA